MLNIIILYLADGSQLLSVSPLKWVLIQKQPLINTSVYFLLRNYAASGGE
jgi:hypothetical protein